MSAKNIIAIEVTSACASSCVKCYRREIWGRGGPMADTIFNRVMDGLSKYHENCSILLGTGEAILETEKIARLIEWSNSTRNPIRLLTTGVPLVGKNIDVLAQATNLSTQITLDGFSERDLEGVQRIVFSKVKEKISLAAKRLKLILNYTLTNKNHQSLCDVIVFANQNGIDQVYVTPMMSYELCDAAQNFIPRMDDPATIISLSKAKDLAENLGVKLYIGTGKANPLKSASELQRHCEKVGLLRPIVRVDGKVSICWGREDVVLGDLHVDHLNELLMSETLTSIRKKHATGTLSKFCDDCIVYANSTRSVMKIPQRDPSISAGSFLDS